MSYSGIDTSRLLWGLQDESPLGWLMFEVDAGEMDKTREKAPTNSYEADFVLAQHHTG